MKLRCYECHTIFDEQDAGELVVHDDDMHDRGLVKRTLMVCPHCNEENLDVAPDAHRVVEITYWAEPGFHIQYVMKQAKKVHTGLGYSPETGAIQRPNQRVGVYAHGEQIGFVKARIDE